MPATPIVKWLGGKTRLLRELQARTPKTFNRYYEPFAGGAALFFALNSARAVLGDLNGALINLYRNVAQDPLQVSALLEVHRHQHARVAYYYEVRERWNSGTYRDATVRAAAFLYLNKTCFNGLWRVNKQGAFNAARGDYGKASLTLEEVCDGDDGALIAASQPLRRARLVAGGYVMTTRDVGYNDFVYFDPPYDPLTATANFTTYTQDVFGAAQQEALALYAVKLAQRGVHVMLSNNDTPRVRQLYQGFHIDTVACGRSINCKGVGRGKVNEVIITSYQV